MLRPVFLPAYSSKRIFDACTTEGQSTNDPLGRAIPATHSEAAVTGEALYVDDLPPQPSNGTYFSRTFYPKLITVGLPDCLSYARFILIV